MSDIAPLADPQISPELAAVIRYALHDGLDFNIACAKAGMNPYAAIAELDRPGVRAFTKQQAKVRLARAKLGTVSALERVRDRDDPKSDSAAVKAAMALEALAASYDPIGVATVAGNTPGVTINIINGLSANSGPHHQGQHVQGMTLEHDPHAIEARAAADSINHPDAAAEPAHDRPPGKNQR